MAACIKDLKRILRFATIIGFHELQMDIADTIKSMEAYEATVDQFDGIIKDLQVLTEFMDPNIVSSVVRVKSYVEDIRKSFFFSKSTALKFWQPKKSSKFCDFV